MRNSIRISTIALLIAGTAMLAAPWATTTAILVDREIAHIQFAGSAEAPLSAEGATRTHGFWLSHPALTGHILTDHLGGSIDCGPLLVTSTEGALGALAADPNRDSNGAKRDKLGKAQVLCTRQLVAAALSGAFTNAAPVPLDARTGLDLLSAARTALNARNASECVRISELLAAYLGAHCEVDIVLDCGYATGPSQEALGLSLANTSIMDPAPPLVLSDRPSVPPATAVVPEPERGEPATTEAVTPEPTAPPATPEDEAPTPPAPASEPTLAPTPAPFP